MKKLLPLSFALLLGFSSASFAQGGNTCAAAAAAPITIPFSAAGSTCNGTDDINNLISNCGSLPSIYTTGPDWFYYFCATSTGQVSIALNNINPCPAWSSISVWSGCPTATNCIAASVGTACSQALTFNAVNAQCYYIMIDNWPTPACFAYTIDIQMILPPPCNPQCMNADFENGTFSGWYGTFGTISTGPINAPYPTYNQSGVGLPSAQHTMMTGPGLDACGGFPVVFPGGNFSVMIGNGMTTGYGGGTLEQTFTVSATTSSFTYNYAVVVQDATHNSWEQPFFKVDVIDAAGNPITCGQYLVVGGPNIPNFFLAPCSFQTYYRPWTTVNIDLSAYISQCVTVRFTVGDCSQGGHFGYAYVDASCAPMQIIGVDTICTGNSTTICAPPGAGAYTWNPGGATTQCITVSPTATTVYSVVVQSLTNPNCFTTLYDTVYVIPGPVAAFTATPNSLCAGGNVVIVNNSTGNPTTWTWIWGDLTPNSNLQNPSGHSYSGSGTYTITLIVSNGACSDTITQTITLVGNGVVANFQATAVCLNNPTVFTDLTTGGATQWAWNFGEPASGPNNVSNLQNPTHTYSNPGTYTVTLISNSGSPQCGDTIVLTVTVHPLPTPLFIATSVCVGQATIFTDQSSITGGSITAWSWNFGDPNSGPANLSNLQNPTHVYTTAGSFTVILTTTSDQGCQNSITVTVTVFPLPVAAFAFINVCMNNPMQFTDQSTGATSWIWNFGDLTPNSTLQNPTHSYTAAGNYTVTLIVIGQGNCSDTITQQVTVFPGPTPQFVATTVCQGYPTIFTDQSTVSTGNITTWNWNFGDATPNSNVQSPTHMYALAGTYTVTLTVTSNNGCSATSTLTVIVNPLPNAAFIANAVCIGVATQFTDQSTISSGNIQSWSWNFGDVPSGPNNVSTLQNPTHVFTSAGTFVVSLIVTSASGCVDSASVSITVNPLPTALLTANDTDGCSTHCVNFTDLSTVTTGTITQWLWDFGDGNTSTAQNPSHCFSNSTQNVVSYTITLTVTTSTGCVNTITIVNYIDVFPIPIASASADPSVTTVTNTLITFTDLSIGNPVWWVWDFGDGSNIDSSQNPQHYYPDENTGVHTYTVTLTIANQWGCTSSTTLEIIINPEFTFYAPNCVTPNNDGINDFFFTYGIGWKEYKLMIFDRWGDLIWWTEDMNKGWNAKVLKGHSGDLVQEDVYVWKVVLTDVFDKRHTYIGHVSVIR